MESHGIRCVLVARFAIPMYRTSFGVLVTLTEVGRLCIDLVKYPSLRSFQASLS